jgi:hypothetical protein
MVTDMVCVEISTTTETPANAGDAASANTKASKEPFNI